MSAIQSINNFQTFEPIIKNIETQINWLGTRYVVLNVKNNQSDKTEKIRITFSTFCTHINKIGNQTLHSEEHAAGKRILTHLNEVMLKQFEAELKSNCFKRLIVAIRDFFTCFFKHFSSFLKNLNTKLGPDPFERAEFPSPSSNCANLPLKPVISDTNTIAAINDPIVDQLKPKQDKFQSLLDQISYQLKQFLPAHCYAALLTTNKATSLLKNLHEVALPNPTQKPVAQNKFTHLSKVISFVLKPLLPPSSYAALLRTDRSNHQLLAGHDRLSFDAKHLIAVYNITHLKFNPHALAIADLGLTRADVQYSIQGICDAISGLLIENSQLFLLGGKKLFKIDYQIDPFEYLVVTSIPKNAFSPPRTEDLEFHPMWRLEKINEKYFAIRSNPSLSETVSLWSFDTLECVYANTLEGRMFFHNNSLFSLSKNENTLTVSKKELAHIEASITSFEIILPPICNLFWIAEGGIICTFDRMIVHYDLTTGKELCRLNFDPNRMCVLSITANNQFIVQERLIGHNGRYHFAGKLNMIDLHTNEVREIAAVNELHNFWSNTVFKDKFLVVQNSSNRLSIIDIETNTVITTIDTPDRWQIKHYFFSKKGDLVILLFNNEHLNQLIIYEPLTNSVKFQNYCSTCELFERDNFLIIYESKELKFIDLTTYRLLNSLDTKGVAYHHFQDGKIVLSDIKYPDTKAIITIYDYRSHHTDSA